MLLATIGQWQIIWWGLQLVIIAASQSATYRLSGKTRRTKGLPCCASRWNAIRMRRWGTPQPKKRKAVYCRAILPKKITLGTEAPRVRQSKTVEAVASTFGAKQNERCRDLGHFPFSVPENDRRNGCIVVIRNPDLQTFL